MWVDAEMNRCRAGTVVAILPAITEMDRGLPTRNVEVPPSQISELVDICRDCTPSELSAEKDGENETLRTLVLMDSHMELIFLYARKNRASVMPYRKEINATI